MTRRRVSLGACGPHLVLKRRPGIISSPLCPSLGWDRLLDTGYKCTSTNRDPLDDNARTLLRSVNPFKQYLLLSSNYFK